MWQEEISDELMYEPTSFCFSGPGAGLRTGFRIPRDTARKARWEEEMVCVGETL